MHNKIARDFLLCILVFAAYIRQKRMHNKFKKIACRWKQEISDACADQLEAGRGGGG